MVDSERSALLDMACKITALTGDIVAQLQDAHIPEPNFSASSSDVPSTAAYSVLRDSLNDATQDLLLLVNGPRNHARQFFCTQHDLAAYQIAFEYGFFRAVPGEGSIKVSTLAQMVHLDEDIVARVLYLLCTQRVFEERSKDEFAHTHASIVFAKEVGLHHAAEYQLDEFFKAAANTASSLREDAQSPFEKTFGVPLFQYYEQHPKLGARFASAMAGITKCRSKTSVLQAVLNIAVDRQTSELQNGFPWAELGNRQVVDIGGGSGHVSIALAEVVPSLQIIVQDVNPTMFAQTSKQVSGPVGEGRVTFMQHDFFQAQPVHAAGAYLLRQVTHNWRDEDCIKIFKAIVPALETSPVGTPLLINDSIIPEHRSTTRYEERGLRQVDMMMLVVLGAKQRTLKEFEEILESADARLKVKKAHSQGTMGLLEIHLEGNPGSPRMS